jgi:hypothetical protein
LRLKQRILHDELTFLRSNPGTPFYIMFDYFASYTTCKPIGAASSTFPRLDSVGWSLQNGWASKSRGRMQVDVMQVGDGGSDSLWIFPLRSASSECRTGLEIFAAVGDIGAEARREADRVEIQHLADLNILKFHA